jgi:hypothetical protein
MMSLTWIPSTYRTTGLKGLCPVSDRLEIEVYRDFDCWCWMVNLVPYQMEKELLARGMEDTLEEAQEACRAFLERRIEQVLSKF